MFRIIRFVVLCLAISSVSAITCYKGQVSNSGSVPFGTGQCTNYCKYTDLCAAGVGCNSAQVGYYDCGDNNCASTLNTWVNGGYCCNTNRCKPNFAKDNQDPSNPYDPYAVGTGATWNGFNNPNFQDPNNGPVVWNNDPNVGPASVNGDPNQYDPYVIGDGTQWNGNPVNQNNAVKQHLIWISTIIMLIMAMVL